LFRSDFCFPDAKIGINKNKIVKILIKYIINFLVIQI
jgi:hypothetical protein